MTKELAEIMANKVGGRTGWSSQAGHYVIKPDGSFWTADASGTKLVPLTGVSTEAETPYGAEPSPWQTVSPMYPSGVYPMRPPWETAAGEGFVGRWTPQQYKTDPETGQRIYRATPAGEGDADVIPITSQDEAQAQSALDQLLGGVGGVGLVEPLTYEEALAKQQQLGPEYYMEYDATTGGYMVTRQPFGLTDPGMTEWQRAQLELQQQEAAFAQQQAGLPPEAPQWRPGEFGLLQQQQAQEQQNYLAQMAAQPASWLQHAGASGQPPSIQPWMMPLMSQQYQGLEGLRVGQAIPGWPEQLTGTTGGMGGGGFPPQTTPTGGGTPTGAGIGGGQLSPEQLTAKYISMGLSPAEAEKEALHEIAYESWLAMPTGAKGKRQAFLETGQIAAERPETVQKYQQAISNVQSGQPLLGSLGVQDKFGLVEQLMQQGTDRTLAERQVFGGDMFSKYAPVSGITGQEYTPPITPTTPARTAAEIPGYVPPYEYPEIKPRAGTQSPAYIPGMSWHMIDLYKNRGGRQEGQETPVGEVTNTRKQFTQTSPQTTTAATQATPSQSALGTASNLPLGGMPWLTRPSRQYQARMGPTALQQYYAYQQARTGATPEEMSWRLWSTAPPGGRYQGLSYTR